MKLQGAVSISAFFIALLIPAFVLRGQEPREVSLFEEALTMSRYFDPGTDANACRKAFSGIVEKIRADLKTAGITVGNREEKRKEIIGLLNRHLLTDRKVSYLSNKYWRDSLFTAALMRGKGNCLATSLLYHLVAQELKLPIGMQYVPEHVLVSWEHPEAPLYIETTAGGEFRQRKDILERYGLKEVDLKPNGYLTPLTPKQLRAKLHHIWSNMLYSMGNRPEARRLLAKARSAWPDNPSFRLSEAGFLQQTGEIDKARKVYLALFRENNGPFIKTTAARVWSGFLTSRGRIDEALNVLTRHWQDAPLYHKVEMIDQIGELYRHKRDWEKAIQFHQLHARLDPGESSFNSLGSVLTEAHRDPEAIKAYERALGYNPENFFTRVILAGLYERSGDKEKGRAFFAAIKEPREHKGTWYCALVWYYANIKEEEKLVENMRLALELDRGGHVYQYFIREPDLDPYRERPAFKALMDAHAPNKEKPAPKPVAEPEPVGVAP